MLGFFGSGEIEQTSAAEECIAKVHNGAITR